MSTRINRVDAAFAMARGRSDYMLVEPENKKIWRFQRNGQPALVIERLKGKLNLWVSSRDQWPAEVSSVAAFHRREGEIRNGQAAVPGNPGMHSNLFPFFRTHDLTCFQPASLDEAWLILENA